MKDRSESDQKRGVVQLLLAIGLVVLLMALLVWGVPGATPAHADPGILYVDGASGSDDSDCSSSADPCASIGYALTQAGNGDEIRVAEGSYLETLHIQISVTLEGGYEATAWTRDIGTHPTIVDANGADDGAISIHPGLSVMVEGLIVQGANHTSGQGGGFFIENATAVISATIIRNNSGTDGGGINIGQGDGLTASLTLVDSALLTNTAVTGAGGGLHIGGWPPPAVALENVKIHGNVAAGGGGGIGGMWATLTNCQVVSNTAGTEGGGIGLIHAYIYSSTISHNQALNAGGSGILVRFGRLHLQDSVVSNNHGSGHGIEAGNAAGVTVLDTTIINNGNDGIAPWSSPFTLTNVLIADNGGSGIVGDSNPLTGTMMNVTIATNGNNGIQMTGSDVRVINSILWGNGGQDNNCSGNCTFTYSDIGTGDTTGTGNISEGPLFVDDGAGDYHLRINSPCKDAGTPAGAPPADLEGTPRDAVPDMGAYEWTGFRIFLPLVLRGFGP